MSETKDKWIIKAIGGQRLEIEVPEDLKVKGTGDIMPEELLAALARYVHKQKVGGKELGCQLYCKNYE